MPVTLPELPAPNGATATLLDYGMVQRPGTGAAAQRIDRPGSRFRIELSFPPMPNADTGRVFLARLLRAKAQGLRIDYPLLGVDQGSPGAPVVDGGGQAGTSLALRGCTPGYAVGEGYWLSLASGNRSFLHNISAPAVANGTGLLGLAITPALRFPFNNGTLVQLVQPVIDGFVVGEEWAWQMDINHHLGLSVTIEEWG